MTASVFEDSIRDVEETLRRLVDEQLVAGGGDPRVVARHVAGALMDVELRDAVEALLPGLVRKALNERAGNLAAVRRPRRHDAKPPAPADRLPALLRQSVCVSPGNWKPFGELTVKDLTRMAKFRSRLVAEHEAWQIRLEGVRQAHCDEIERRQTADPRFHTVHVHELPEEVLAGVVVDALTP